jgi:hypothetical protein
MILLSNYCLVIRLSLKASLSVFVKPDIKLSPMVIITKVPSAVLQLEPIRIECKVDC